MQKNTILLTCSGYGISRFVIIYCGYSQIVSFTLITINSVILKINFTIQTKNYSPYDYLPITFNADFSILNSWHVNCFTQVFAGFLVATWNSSPILLKSLETKLKKMDKSVASA